LKKRIITLVAALATAALAPPARAAYLDPGSWYAAATAQPPVTIAAYPGTRRVTYGDDYGSWTAATQNTPTYVGPGANPYNPTGLATRGFLGELPDSATGEWSGFVTCHSAYSGCLGITEITYRLPYRISGIAGDLDYRFGYASDTADALPFFGFDRSFFDPVLGSRYQGFWGNIFAPTNTISILWAHPADSFAAFSLTNARVLLADAVAVPEPGTLAVFGTALIALLGILRPRHTA